MTEQDKIINLINTSTLLLDLARLADSTTQYESGLVVVDEQNSKKTAKYANEIIAEHKVLSSLSASINHFAQELHEELMDLEIGEAN